MSLEEVKYILGILCSRPGSKVIGVLDCIASGQHPSNGDIEI